MLKSVGPSKLPGSTPARMGRRLSKSFCALQKRIDFGDCYVLYVLRQGNFGCNKFNN
jgi:hypothetical protein